MTMLRPVPNEIVEAYDPERMRRDGHRVIDQLADLLANAQARRGPVLPWQEPERARQAVSSLVSDSAQGGRNAGKDVVEELHQLALASTQLHHPRCVGHQVPPPLPIASLAELVASVLNNGMAIYEMGPTAVAVEDAVIDWMLAELGLPVRASGGGGVLTSGGSAGNLTALLAARQACLGIGPIGGERLTAVVGDGAHYSIARAVRIMGWGETGLTLVKPDAHGRMRGGWVRAAAVRAAEQGLRVVAVVAAAGSTAVGAFDPLDEIADAAAELGAWLHVDGAHGASLALSKRHRHRLSGIERADSVVWDAHKLLMMPALVTAVLFRRRIDNYRAFSQEASYLFSPSRDEDEWWNVGLRTLECTKRAMSFEVYAALRAHGREVLAAIVERLIDAAAALAHLIEAHPEFELWGAPEANIVCFRHRPTSVADEQVAIDQHNLSLRQRVIQSGRFYLVTTRLQGKLWLRCALMNPLVEHKDLVDLLDCLRGK